jgi:hypothetical protein
MLKGRKAYARHTGSADLMWLVEERNAEGGVQVQERRAWFFVQK